MTNQTSLYECAIYYHAAGLTVLPSNRIDKRPMIPWKRFQTERPTDAEVKVFFSRSNITGIGLVMGHGYETIDFDLAGKYYETFKILVEECIPELWKRLVIERTPSGGFHIVYRCGEVSAPNLKLATEGIRVDGAGVHDLYGKKETAREINGKHVCVLTGIETRGSGGFVQCAPTTGYMLIQGSFESIPVITQAERDFLISTALSFNQWIEPSKVINTPEEKKSIEKPRSGLTPAEDFNLRGDIKLLLESHGAKELENGQWRRPGKNHGQSASLLKNGNVFYCFSSNWHPFEPGKGYSKFAAYTLLKHNGNYREAALALLDQGFGTPPSRPDIAEVDLDEHIDKISSSEAEEYFDEKKNDATSLDFPNEIMVGVAGDFAETYSKYLESPIHFFYIAFLTCLGNILAGVVSLDSEISPQSRLYTLILGESADDRKSTAIDKATGFFQKMISIGDFLMCHGVGSAEGLAQKIVSGQGLLLVFDELKSFIGKCKIDSSVLLPCVNTLFESNRFESKTKKAEINIQDGRLSILAASTVQTYERCWDPQFTDIGFNNRLFLVPGKGKRRFAFPAKIPADKINRLKQDLSKVLAFVGKDGYEYAITEEARKAYESWYLGLTPSVHTKRLDSYAMRFMQLLAVNETKNDVDLDIVQKVIKLMNWQLAVRKIHDPIDADSKIAMMEEKIRRQVLKSGIKERKLKQLVNANRAGLWIFQSALKNLENAKEIQYDKTNKHWSSC